MKKKIVSFILILAMVFSVSTVGYGCPDGGGCGGGVGGGPTIYSISLTFGND